MATPDRREGHTSLEQASAATPGIRQDQVQPAAGQNLPNVMVAVVIIAIIVITLLTVTAIWHGPPTV